jgi:glutaredoxin
VNCDDSLDKAIDDIMGENHYLDDSDSDIRLSKYIRKDIHRKDTPHAYAQADAQADADEDEDEDANADAVEQANAEEQADAEEQANVEEQANAEEKMLYAPIFLETSLPRKGWIQGCVLCNSKTSNTIFYLDDTYKSFGYMVYCCHFCKRAKEQNEELEIEYNDMILEYIDENKDKIYIKLKGRLPKNGDTL